MKSCQCIDVSPFRTLMALKMSTTSSSVSPPQAAGGGVPYQDPLECAERDLSCALAIVLLKLLRREGGRETGEPIRWADNQQAAYEVLCLAADGVPHLGGLEAEAPPEDVVADLHKGLGAAAAPEGGLAAQEQVGDDPCADGTTSMRKCRKSSRSGDGG